MPTLTKLNDGVLAVTGLPEDAKDFMILGKSGDIDMWKGLPEHYDLYANGIYNTPIYPMFLAKKHYVLGWSDELTDDQLCKLFETPSKLMARLTFDMKLLSHSITDKALIIVKKEEHDTSE